MLFDHFPDGSRVLGGAPFNVAWHLQAFGQAPHFISRVGNDAEGERIRAAMHEWGMDTSGLQTDPAHRPAGSRSAFVDGEPAYDIVHPCAYDAIEAVPRLDRLSACSITAAWACASRLAADPRSSLRTQPARRPCLSTSTCARPGGTREQVLDMLRGAEWVKLNTDELAQLPHPLRATLPSRDWRFLERTSLQGLLLTHGAGVPSC